MINFCAHTRVTIVYTNILKKQPTTKLLKSMKKVFDFENIIFRKLCEKYLIIHHHNYKKIFFTTSASRFS